MLSECDLYEQADQPTLSIRTHAAVQDLPRLIGESYAAIGKYMMEFGVKPIGVPFTAYFNLDMQNLDIEIGFPMDQVVPGQGAIQPSKMPAGMYASVLYTGIYSEMGPAYDTLKEFVEKAGYQPTGVAYEFYLNGPDEVAIENLETRIVFQLQNS